MITKHKVKRKIISVCIAASILFGILVLSPAHSGAVSVSISNLQDGYAQGSKIKFYAEVRIDTDELIPIDHLTITLKNEGSQVDKVLFNVNGSITEHQGPICCIESITQVAMTAIYKCGDLYGYDENEGQGYDFGDGWGYGCEGYGYDWDNPGYLKYECTIDTTGLEYGDYALRVDVNTGSEVHPMFSSSEYSFSIGALGSHNPIRIWSNSDFTSENGVSSGSGTEADPYIIEGWDIDASQGWFGG
ncbi:MAG: hypothetical protein QMC80_04655, partial [Thermoplasmatales archaeon]|nr:hypothetical protein [Thermoplasmatales archaeon]